MCLGVPGKIVSISDGAALPMAKVDFGGITRDVCVAYTPEAKPGDYVVVHVGFAISRLDETEALRVFTYLAEAGLAAEVGEDEGAAR